MFNEKDIVARLANGENPGDIANQFASMLNRLIEDQRAAIAAEKAKREKEARMRDIASDFANVMTNYFAEVNPDLAAALNNEDAADLAFGVLNELAGVLTGLDLPMEAPVCDCGTCDTPCSGVKITDRNGKRTVENITVDEASDILDEFLKGFGF